jgi:vancomycin resistance protein VanW
MIFTKPKKRSDFRLRIGMIYFRLRRHFFWIFAGLGGIKFARERGEAMPFEYFSHSTPLYRQLKNVDMYMQENKVVNLKIAAARLQNIILRPGETFSYWKVIGKPTAKKGYLKGMVLKSGEVTAAVGGGLCQLSNLIYWITAHTPLTVVERHRHGYDVFPDSGRSQPFGSGATCFYNYGDLMIKNDCDVSFQLRLAVGEKELEGAWLCDSAPKYRYEVYESEHVIKYEFWGRYTRNNVIRRKKFAVGGELLGDEFLVENRAIMMYSPFIEAKA